MYRKYYSYNDMPSPVLPAQKHAREEKKEEERPRVVDETDESIPASALPAPAPERNNKFLGKFENDDILILVVIFILLSDGCDDDLLIIALAVIFLLGK